MRADSDDVVTEDDLKVTHQGRPFTGEVIERTSTGAVVALTTYHHGIEDGPSAEWYPTGERKAEGMVNNGMPTGIHNSWHRNGTLATFDKFSDKGKLLIRRRWTESGDLIEDNDYQI
ncbi:toxin-antitoxin system YwqK family antitoxin [Actinokineospora sp. G85]|uniref:toxin-antitoxin system YwqK family antitoxin n=1 Tax=Actinokineospora sp. G85 TaxID=3406626 RepID=UPI003C715941